MNKQDLLRWFDKIECYQLKDQHPDVHEVIADFLIGQKLLVDCDVSTVESAIPVEEVPK